MLKGILCSGVLFLKPFRQLAVLFLEMWWLWAAIIVFSGLVTCVALVFLRFWLGVL